MNSFLRLLEPFAGGHKVEAKKKVKMKSQTLVWFASYALREGQRTLYCE